MKTIISVMRGVWYIPSLVVHKINSIMYMLYIVLTSAQRLDGSMEFDVAMRLVGSIANKEGVTLECEELENSMKLTIKFEVDMDMSD